MQIKNILLFLALENPLVQHQSTFPTGGGVKLQQAEADVMLLERIKVLFQTSVSTEVKFTYTETPPTCQGTPRLLFHLCTTPLLSHIHSADFLTRILMTITYLCVTLVV